MITPPNPPADPSPGVDGPNCRWEGCLSNGVGTTTGTPMAFMSADPNELVLSGTLGTFHLPRASVVKICRGDMYPWFFSGIRVHHRDPKCPAELQFKPGVISSRELRAQLRALGYPAV